MREYTKLRAFELVDEVAMLVYRETAGFLKSDRIKDNRNREGLKRLDSCLAG